jgi:hypothetical protein
VAKKAFATAVGLASDPLKDWAEEYVDGFVGTFSKSITFLPNAFLDALLDQYKDRFVEVNVKLVRKALAAKPWISFHRRIDELASNLWPRLPDILQNHAEVREEATKDFASRTKDDSRLGQTQAAKDQLKRANASLFW